MNTIGFVLAKSRFQSTCRGREVVADLRLRFGQASMPATRLIRAGQPADGTLDAIARKDAPGLDLGHVGRLRKAAKHLARFLARGLPRQGKGLAPKRVPLSPLLRKNFCRPACHVGGTTNGTHERLAVRNVIRDATATESSVQVTPVLAASAMAASASGSSGKPAAV